LDISGNLMLNDSKAVFKQKEISITLADGELLIGTKYRPKPCNGPA
jgi:hypothetical protein